MGRDNELRVAIMADSSQLGTGLADAQTKVEATATAMAEAQAIAAQATKRLAEAQVQLGAAAEGGNLQAKKIIQEYAEASAQAASAVEALGAAAATAAPQIAEEAVAAEAAAAATQVLGVSSRQAATAGIGILEGRMMSGNRAAAAFLSTTLGLGPVIQAAFPVIGALALGEVLFDIGRGAYNAYEKFISLDAVSEKLLEDFKKMQQSDVINVRSIETATERLDQADASATKLREAAESLHEVGFKGLFSDLLQGNATAAGIDIAQLAGARRLADEGARNTRDSIALNLKQIELQHQLNVAKIEAGHAGDGALAPEKKITAELEKQLAIHREDQQYGRLRERAMGNEAPATSGAQLRSLEDQAAYAKAGAEATELNRRAVALFVSESINEYKNLESENKRVIEEVSAAWTAGQKSDEEMRRKEEEAERKRNEEFKRDRAEEVQLAKQGAEDQIAAANELFTFSERQIRADEELGRISHAVGTDRLLSALALKEASTKGALGSVEELFDPNLGEKELAEYKQFENKMTQETRKATLERQQIENQEAIRYAEIWTRALDKISSEFNRDVAQWIVLHKSLAESLSQIVAGISENFIKNLLKMTEQEIVAAATHKDLLKQGIIGDAHKAASGAYQAVVGIPYVGPFLAPVAAAAAFAGVIAFESFEAGGIVNGASGSPVPIMAHAGERVLSAGQTHNFESLVNHGGARSATLNQENHFGGGVTADMLADHTARTMSALRGMIRPEALA